MKAYLNPVKYLEECYDTFGDCSKGVHWPNEEDAKVRYKVMTDLIRFDLLRREQPQAKAEEEEIRLLDFGCGLSHYYAYLEEEGRKNIRYTGVDISEKYVNASREKYPDNRYYCIDILEEEFPERNDYTVVNGIFTFKNTAPFEEMFDFWKKCMTRLYALSDRGIAFNAMSKQVDWERDDLFHLPLDMAAEFLCKNLTRNFIIRNDYGLYEYTVYIFKS